MQEIPVTWGLSILHGLLYVYVSSMDPTFSTETLMKVGALSSPAVWHGEYYRILVSGLLHGGLAHFLMNNFALIMLGQLLERLFGSVGFFWLYLMALLAGNVASLVFMSPMSVSVGASGAIMGLAGALTVLLLLDRNERFLEAQPFGKYLFLSLIVFQLFVGGLIPFINNAAHIGGFIVGICFGLFFWSRIPGSFLPRVVGSGLIIVCVLGFSALAVRGIAPENTDSFHIYTGLKAFQNRNTKLAFQNAKIAEDEFLAAIKANPSSIDARLYLGELYIQRRQFKKAVPVFGALVGKEPNRFLFWIRWIHALALSGQLTATNKAFLKAKALFIEGKKAKGFSLSSFFSSIVGVDKELLLARLYVAALKERKAISLYLELLEEKPKDPTLGNDFAWLLVTAHNHTLRNPKLAIDYAELVTKRYENAAFLDTLATGYFEDGQVKKAIQIEKKAIILPSAKWSMPHFHYQLIRFEKAYKKRKKKALPSQKKAKKQTLEPAKKKIQAKVFPANRRKPVVRRTKKKEKSEKVQKVQK